MFGATADPGHRRFLLSCLLLWPHQVTPSYSQLETSLPPVTAKGSNVFEGTWKGSSVSPEQAEG